MDRPEVASPAELLGLAVYIEDEAARLFSRLAKRLHDQGEHEGARRLTGLAERAAAQKAALTARAEAAGTSPASLDAARVSRLLAAAGSEDEAEPLRLTAYRALAWAVRRAEGRFRLYSTLAAHAENGALRALAETLAREALADLAGLRAERRQAYHAERAAGRPDLAALARAIASLEDLRASALAVEMELARQLLPLARASSPAAEALAVTRALLDEMEEAESVASLDLRDLESRGIVGALDEAFAFYDLVQSRAADEAVMELAQGLAQRTLERIQLLKGGTESARS